MGKQNIDKVNYSPKAKKQKMNEHNPDRNTHNVTDFYITSTKQKCDDDLYRSFRLICT